MLNRTTRRGNSRRSSTLPQRFLGSQRDRHVGLSCGIGGIQNRVCARSSVIKGSFADKVASKRALSNATGDRGDAEEGRYRASEGSVGRFLFDVLPSTKERWGVETCSQPEAIEQVCKYQKVQNAFSSVHSSASIAGRLVGRNRFKGCVFSHPYASRSQEVPEVCIPGSNLSVQGSSFRFVNSTKGVYKGVGSSDRPNACQRRKNFPISRRLSSSCRQLSSVTGHVTVGKKSICGSRICDKSKKIKASTVPEVTVFGDAHRHWFRKSLSTTGESAGFGDLCSSFYESRSVQRSTPISETSRPYDGFNTDGTLCSAVHETDSVVSERQVEYQFSEPKVSADDHHGISFSSSLVDELNQSFDGPVMASSVDGLDSDDRCLSDCMGRSFRSIQGSGKMEISPNGVTHKCTGTAGSMEFPQGISSYAAGSECSLANRQSSGAILHQQVGGNKIPKYVQFSLADDKLVHRQEDRLNSSLYSRGAKCYSGQIVKTFVPSDGMGAQRYSVAGSFSEMGNASDRFVCVPTKCEVGKILYPEVPSSSMGKGCISAELDESICLRLPSISSSKGSVVESEERQVLDDSHCTQMDQERMVQSTSGSVSGYSSHASVQEESGLSGEGLSFACQPSRVMSDGLADQRNVLIAEGFSRKTADTILASKSKNTMAQYRSGWNHFSEWCSGKDIDPYTSTISMILNYFQDCFDQGLQFNTVKSRQSAIAANHARFPFRCSLASHPAVKKFLKGAAIKYASVKTRVPAWDLPIVLKALKSSPFEPMESIDIKFVTLKTAFLLAVVSARRLGELQAFDVRPQFSSISPNGVVLRANAHFVPKIPSMQNMENVLEVAPYGIQNRGHPQGTAKALCICRALSIYVDRTKDVRKSDQLFVSFKPGCEGRKVSKNTLASWIKKVVHQAYSLQDLQPPVGVKAHGTRAQSVSWADMKGISILDICRMAGWKKADTFINHYKLQLSSENSVSARHANRVLQASEWAE